MLILLTALVLPALGRARSVSTRPSSPCGPLLHVAGRTVPASLTRSAGSKPQALRGPFSRSLLAGDPLQTQASAHLLDNGLVLLLEPNHRTDTVGLFLAYGVGSRDESEGSFGTAHLFEHLMFEGSKNVPTNAFDTLLTAAGGDNNAWTSEDTTAYHMSFPSGALDLALFLESDRMGFLDAGLDAANLANQQGVVLQERAEGYSQPNGRDMDALTRLVWPDDHPLDHPVIGTVADIEGYELDQVLAFWHAHYRSRNATLALVGNFDPDVALERVQSWMSDVPDRGPAPERMAPAPAGNTGASGVIEDKVEENSIYLAWPTVPETHPDHPVLELLSWVLSGGQGTRLDDALYYDHSFASDQGAEAYGMDTAGQFLVYASSPRSSVKKLNKKIDKLMAGLLSQPPSASELTRARTSVKAGWLDAMEWPVSRAELLVQCQRQHGEPNCLPAEWARYQAVTPDDLVRVSRELLAPERANRLSVVPIGQASTGLPGSQPVELP